MIWTLVFWLVTPGNYANYAVYKSEVECRNSAQVWNYRLEKVKSKLIAECRVINE